MRNFFVAAILLLSACGDHTPANPAAPTPTIAQTPAPTVAEHTWSGTFAMSVLSDGFEFETPRAGEVTLSIHADCDTSSWPLWVGVSQNRDPDRIEPSIRLADAVGHDATVGSTVPAGHHAAVIHVNYLTRTPGSSACGWRIGLQYPR